MKKNIIIILIVAALLQVRFDDSMSQSITGIKPFTIYTSMYHYIDQEKHTSYDLDIGKRIKVIEFDGSSIKVTKMGILERQGSIIKCGPFLDKNLEPIRVSYGDKNFDNVIEDIINTYYQYEFVGDKNIFFVYSSSAYDIKSSNGMLLTSGSSKWARTQISKETIKNKSATSQFVILDDDKQYHYFEVENGKLNLKFKLAINPDYFDKTLPYLRQMLPIYRSFWPRNYKNGYLWMSNDNRKIVESGIDRYIDPPVLSMRNGVYFVSTYLISQRLGCGIMHNKQEKFWKIAKMVNPSLDELYFIEVIFKEEEKEYVYINGEKKKLDNPWYFPVSVYSEPPYVSIRELSKILEFKYSYRDIDKTILMP